MVVAGLVEKEKKTKKKIGSVLMMVFKKKVFFLVG